MSSTQSTAERMVLRAELVHEARQIIAHTTEINSTSVVIRTDEPMALGDRVAMRLSFPRLFEPLSLDAKVVAVDPGLGHGYGAVVRFDYRAAAAECARLAWLLGDGMAKDARRFARILVIEDSALVRDFVQFSADRFSSGNVRVVVDATDTAEAGLALLDTTTYDLVLVDLYLPGTMDGAAVVRNARATEPDLPVIGFSVGGITAREAFLSAGADLFLEKPVTIRDVFTTLERLVLKKDRAA